MNDKISVIIPVYNEESEIIKCLSSLEKQQDVNFEVVLIDDGSTDQTLGIVSDYRSEKYHLKLLQSNHRGPGAARNLGAKYAKGSILVFVDADMTFSPDFLKKLVEPIRQKLTKGTFSKEEYVANWENALARCWNINEGWEMMRRHPAFYPDTQKVFRAILKSEFDSVGGFIPGGYTDDYSLSDKLGYEAQVSPGAVFYHSNPDNPSDIFSQAGWVAKRSYKLGLVGLFVALFRASLPVSVAVGVIKSLKFREPAFVMFKVVYDLGISWGILERLITNKTSK